MAKEWQSRPSDLLAVKDRYVAYCLDEALSHFGKEVEEAMQNVKGKTEAIKRGKAENVLRSYMGLDPKYRNVGELQNKKSESSFDG